MKTKNIVISFFISLFFVVFAMQVQAEENTDVKNEVNTKEKIEKTQKSSVNNSTSKPQKKTITSSTTTSQANTNEKLNLLAADVAEVGTPEALKEALANTTITTVKLNNDIYLGTDGFPVAHNVTIDGQNHTITYAGGTSSTRGIYFNANSITIHYKNINFGYKSELGKKSTKNANNYYGFTPGNSRTNITLISENLNYYSDYGAQPFHMTGSGTKLLFAGTNEFIMDDQSSYGQEFAEARYLEFMKGSSTTVKDTNGNATIGFIWTASGGLNFLVDEGAKVDVQTTRDFIYTDPAIANITLNKNSQLNIKTIEPHHSQGRLIYQTGKTLNLNVGESAKLNVNTINPNVLGTFNADFEQSSISRFTTGKTNVFSTALGILNIKNSKEVSFYVTNSPGSTTGPIGISGSASLINFSANTPQYNGYQVFLNSNQTPTVNQQTAGSWVLFNGFTRIGEGFTTEQNNAMKTAQVFRILRNRPINTSFSQTAAVKDKTVQLEKYAAKKKGKETIDFYWQDPDAGDTLLFKAYDAQNNEVATTPKITTTGQAGPLLQQIDIPTTNLSYGDNNYKIKVFEVLDDGSIVENSASALNLKLQVEGALYFTTITPNFSWTNRKMLDTKGILNRDVGNNLSMNIVDSRQNPTKWTVTATLQNQTQNPPFTFVWKANETATPTAITGQSILTNTDATTVEQYLYNKTWNEKTAVLLKSEEYIKPGLYNNQSIINWTLNSVPDTP